METPSKWDAHLYDTKHSFVYNYGEELIESLEPKPTDRILDLGCGTGFLTNSIAERKAEVIGLDSSPEMIKMAKQNYPHIQFEVGDASDFRFSQPFDAIFSNATLHWVKNYREAISCMYDSLKTNGKLVLEFGGKGNVQSIIYELKHAMRRNGYHKEAEINPWYFPSIAEYSTALEEAGFSTTMARLYERPTKLSDSDTGIKDWLTMFGQHFFHNIPTEDILKITNEVQEALQTALFYNNKWYADYVRIRIIATKK